MWQDRAYGVLSLRTEKDNAYRQRELAMARQVGAQIVGAVVVTSLYAETRRVAEERLALSEIGRLVSSSLEFGNVFPEFANRLSQLLPADRIVLAEFDPASERFTDRHIWGVASPGDGEVASYPLGSSLVHETFKSGNPAAWSKADLEQLSNTRPDDDARLESGLQSVLTVPLIWQDWIFGVLNVRSKLDDPYGERELDLARQVGGQIAGAVAVSTLYMQTRRVADDRTTLSEIGRLVSSSLDFSKVFDRLSDKIAALIPADRIVISTFEEPTKTYIDRFVWGVPVARSHIGVRHAPGQSLSFLEDGNREPTVRTRSELEQYVGTVPGVAERFEAGLHSVMRVPLIWQDRIFGELNVRSRLDDPYGPRETEIAKEIGAQIVGAVAVSTLYEEATRTSEERLALSEIGRLVSSSLDFSETYADLAAQLQRLVPFDRLVLSIYDEADGSFVDRFVWGEQVSTNPPGARHKLDTAYIRDAFLEGRSIARNRAELEKLAEFSPGAAEGLRRGLVSALSVPMAWQSKIFGMLNLRSKVEDAYGPRDIELAEQAAAQIAGGFAAAFRYEETVREAELRRALAAMSLASGSDHRLDRIFAGVESELKKIIPYDRIAVTLVEPDSEKLRLVYVRGMEVPGHTEGMVIGLPPGEAAWKSEALILPNDPIHGGAMERAGLHSWLQVPLGNPSSAPIGYLSLRKASRDFYHESDKEILEQVSTYITPGVQNAITQEREAELARQRERATELEQQARELERVNQAKSEFFSAVSHELRTPLTSVVAFTDIIARNRDETLSERDLKHLQIVRRNASHLKVLINDLLDVSQIESGRLELVLRPVDLGRLLHDAADSISHAFDSKRQDLSVDIPRRKLQVDADPDRMTQVVSNLLGNANKFSPTDTTIELRLATEGDHAVISVIDHGPGVPRTEHAQLFTPFFRVDDPATRDVEGTGLGLAISKRLVDLHHGTIAVADTPGGGATFIVRIPLSPDQP
jgi:signal transduction histidine kinase